jgi:chaperonin GroES
MAQPSLAFHTDSYLRIPQQILARTLTPFGDRVLVKRIEAQVTTAGGLYLPTTNVKDPNEGTVVAVGPGERDVTGALHAVNVAVGDKVLLPEYGGSKIKIGDEELFLFRESDILGKFE